MSKYATKAGDNVFCRARYEAAKFNDRLSSREGTSEETGIDKTKLSRIELGSVTPYPEEVLVMADIYNAPELRMYYCREMCPLGKELFSHGGENSVHIVDSHICYAVYVNLRIHKEPAEVLMRYHLAEQPVIQLSAFQYVDHVITQM